jgi:hypothetical protein
LTVNSYQTHRDGKVIVVGINGSTLWIRREGQGSIFPDNQSAEGRLHRDIEKGIERFLACKLCPGSIDFVISVRKNPSVGSSGLFFVFSYQKFALKWGTIG